MRIQIINPNTTAAFTERCVAAARQVAGPLTEIIGRTSTMGPVSIESHYDEALSLPGLLDAIRRGEAEGADGHVIACFGDPGLLAAREIAQGPVIGIAEAAMRAATMIATGFSVVTTLSRTRIIAQHLVDRYGAAVYCRRIRAIDLPVLALEDAGAAMEIILAECRRAKHEDDIGAIVLGCAGMADLPALLSQELGMPVIDGVTVAVKFVEGLVALNLMTSKHGDLAAPPLKPYAGALASFSLAQRATDARIAGDCG